MLRLSHLQIWCGNQFGWVRAWRFLERRWIAFSISHAFPVRVHELCTSIASVTVVCGMNTLSAKYYHLFEFSHHLYLKLGAFNQLKSN